MSRLEEVTLNEEQCIKDARAKKIEVLEWEINSRRNELNQLREAAAYSEINAVPGCKVRLVSDEMVVVRGLEGSRLYGYLEKQDGTIGRVRRYIRPAIVKEVINPEGA